MDDAQLTSLAPAGDRTAWSAIYDQYADRLHDFCWSILRDRQQAQDAVHRSFVAAAAKIGHPRDPELLRPWLYSLARRQALARRRRSPREVLPGPQTDSASAEVRQLRKLVWEAAGGLPARDRALLDLNLRHGLNGDELAEAIGANPQQVSPLLDKVRQDAERALNAVLVARAGLRNCAELNALLADWDGSLAPLLHKRVTRHIDTCLTCAEQRRRLMSPVALLSGVPLLPAPEGLRERVLADIEPATGRTPVLAPSQASPATAPARRRMALTGAFRALGRTAVGYWAAMLRRPRSGVIAAAAALAVIAVLSTVVIATTRQEPVGLGGSPVATSPQATTASQPATTTDATTTQAQPSSTAAVAPQNRSGVDLMSKAIDFGPTATVSVLRFRNTGARPLPWTVSSSSAAVSVKPASGTLAAGAGAVVNIVLDRSKVAEGDFASQLRLVTAGTALVPVTAVENKPPQISDLVVVPAWLVAAPSACASARVSATVEDETLVTVMLSWQQAGGPITDVPMSGAGGRFTTSIGPPAGGSGDIRWWIIASDQRGNAERTTDRVLEVRPANASCPI